MMTVMPRSRLDVDPKLYRKRNVIVQTMRESCTIVFCELAEFAEFKSRCLPQHMHNLLCILGIILISYRTLAKMCFQKILPFFQ